jgi:hypothetical protein
MPHPTSAPPPSSAIAAAAAQRLGDSLVDSARALAATLHAENAAEEQHHEEKERVRAAMRVAVAQGEDLTEVCAGNQQYIKCDDLFYTCTWKWHFICCGVLCG